jgi:RNA-directed DNA polymerase
MVEWSNLNWRKLERVVFKLQKRIYKASQRGDYKAVRRLQKTLIKSWSARSLAVRRVTQDNQGKKTAGVDGIKSLTPKQRLTLIDQIKTHKEVKPVRRIWIPKPNSEENRPLGIPTIKDRTLQMLFKMALEPEWEAKFEPNSYGFRPGRSCQDAIDQIYLSIKQKAKYVLDADIEKCFDRINHKAILEKLNTSPTIRRQIRSWLKAGVMEKVELFPTSEGTPQGGVISPLLANVALHGMENLVKTAFPKRQIKKDGKFHKEIASPNFIRYADDFIVLHEDPNVIEGCQKVIAEWLKGMGLKLKPSKTRITHTLIKNGNEEPGFNFLGFNIRQFPRGKYRSASYRLPGKEKVILGYQTVIKPSKESIQRHYKQLAEIADKYKAASQAELIGKLNPIIRGWANYYSAVISKRIFSEIDNLLWNKLRIWAARRHPRKSAKWVEKKYYTQIGGENSVFSFKGRDRKTVRLINHSATKIVRHVKVQESRSPYDGDYIYWGSRLSKYPEMPPRISFLLRKQKGKCTHCNLHFTVNDKLEVDHITPKSLGGKNDYTNLQLLHKHCHDQKTARDGSNGKNPSVTEMSLSPKTRVNRGMHDKHHIIEEPSEMETLMLGSEDQQVG